MKFYRVDDCNYYRTHDNGRWSVTYEKFGRIYDYELSYQSGSKGIVVEWLERNCLYTEIVDKGF